MKRKIGLSCIECCQQNYSLPKSNSDKRLVLNKFCRQCNKHTTHQEER